MNTCDTCKWWIAPKGINSICPTIGLCDQPRFQKYLGYVAQDEMWAGESPSYPQTPCTGPKFGCIHHEAKPSIELLLPNTPENAKFAEDLGFKPVL